MKLLALLVVALAVHGIHSQLSGFRPSWKLKSYIPTEPHQRVVYYNSPDIQQKDYSRRYLPVLEDDQPINQDWPTSRSQGSSLNADHKYFFLDNEAHVVHSIRPFIGEPLSYLFNFNSYDPPIVGGLTRPAFARRTVSTLYRTYTSTVVTPTINACIPTNLFTNPNNVTSCVRRRRSIYEDDLLEVSPSPVTKEQVIPTNLVYPSGANYEIESSKEFDDQSDIFTRQDKRFKLIKTETATLTVYTFIPTIIKKPIAPVNNPLSGQNGVLLCIPPGIVVC